MKKCVWDLKGKAVNQQICIKNICIKSHCKTKIKFEAKMFLGHKGLIRGLTG